MNNLMLYATAPPDIQGNKSSFTTFKATPSLPNGLSIVESGVIAGTPNDEEKIYTVNIVACNDNQCSPSTEVIINLKCK